MDAMVVTALSSPVRVRDVLVAAVPKLQEHLREEAIRQDWERIVGSGIARRSQPGALRMGVLDVTVDNSPWLHELTLRGSELLGALQSRHGSAVTSLRFTLGTVARASSAVTPRRRRASPPAPLGHAEARVLEAMVAPVADPALAASLRRILTKDLLARRSRGASPCPDDPPPPQREDS